MNKLRDQIKECLSKFTSDKERNKKQTEAIINLSKRLTQSQITNIPNKISALQGPSGCGKTKMFLEWLLYTLADDAAAAAAAVIVPRVAVGKALFDELCKNYLPNSTIELVSGAYKLTYNQITKSVEDTPEDKLFSASIVICTIDQVVGSMFSSKNITFYMEILKRHLIFDEFHELLELKTHNLFFAEILEAKKLMENKTNTLLVSATPNYKYCENLLGIRANQFVTMESFNKTKYSIELIEYDEGDYDISPAILESYDSIEYEFYSIMIFTNTIKTAQYCFLENKKENSFLLHSYHTDQQKKKLLDEAFDYFGENGNKKRTRLRTTRISQASFNISANWVITEACSPESLCQRLGRCERFGKKDTAKFTIVASKQFLEGKENKFGGPLKRSHCAKTALAFIKFLKRKGIFEQGKQVTITEFYRIYFDFYQDPESIKAIDLDFKSLINDSINNFKKNDNELKSFPTKNSENSIKHLAAKSYRGSSVYVQAAIYRIDSGLTNEYIITNIKEDNLTVDADKLKEKGNGIPVAGEYVELIRFIVNNNKNVVKVTGIDYAKDARDIIRNARSNDKPIHLSYTNNDLNKIGKFLEDPVYYVINDKQSIGLMKKSDIDKLTK
jgi:CRISPR-associated endonuclease/helicase Cas3